MQNINPIRKERYENLKKASALPFGKRMRYYFDFFKFHLLAFLIVAVLVFLILKEIVFAPDVIMNCCIINRTEIPSCTDEEFISSFPDYQLINSNKEKIYFSSDLFLNDTDIDSAAKLIATASSGDIDLIVCNEETFMRLCQMGLLEDIENISYLYEKYNDRLIYYDHTKNGTPEDDSSGIRPYGIEITGSTVLKSFTVFGEDEKIYICPGINTKPNETVLHFVEWISL